MGSDEIIELLNSRYPGFEAPDMTPIEAETMLFGVIRLKHELDRERFKAGAAPYDDLDPFIKAKLMTISDSIQTLCDALGTDYQTFSRKHNL